MYMRIEEFGQLVDKSPDTLRRWEKSGRLIPHRFNGCNHRYYGVEHLQSIYGKEIGVEIMNKYILTKVVV